MHAHDTRTEARPGPGPILPAALGGLALIGALVAFGFALA